MQCGVVINLGAMRRIEIVSGLSRKARCAQRGGGSIKDGLLLIDPLLKRIASVVPRHILAHVKLLSVRDFRIREVRIGNGSRHHGIRHLELA